MMPSAHTSSGSALLAIDLQSAMTARVDAGVVRAAATAISAARVARILVIFARVAFQPGHPEISPKNRQFASVKERGLYVVGDESTHFDPAVSPTSADVVVAKMRSSAFSGNELQTILRARGTGSLAITGIFTSGAILSTVREAADLDYDLTVLSDACGDVDAQLHDFLLRRVFPAQADVVSVDEWINRIEK
jgi:nicotinamidase-related amidase